MSRTHHGFHCGRTYDAFQMILHFVLDAKSLFRQELRKWGTSLSNQEEGRWAKCCWKSIASLSAYNSKGSSPKCCQRYMVGCHKVHSDMSHYVNSHAFLKNLQVRLFWNTPPHPKFRVLPTILRMLTPGNGQHALYMKSASSFKSSWPSTSFQNKL